MATFQLGDKIKDFCSFQADFYHDPSSNGNHLFKHYHNDRNIFEKISLADPIVRDQIISREVELNQILASNLQCQKVTIRNGSGKEISSLRMKKLRSEDFLSQQIKSGKKPSETDLKKVAKLIVFFHQSDYCVKVNIVESLGQRFLDLVTKDNIEIVKIQTELAHFCGNINTVLADYIDQSYQQLQFREECLNEPHLCHGDIKTANVTKDGEQMLIIDPAPLLEWQTLDRRVDAITLKIDLECLGQEEAAAAYWQHYSELSQQKNEELEASNKVIDVIGSIYYLVVLLKVSLLEKDEEKIKKVKEKLTTLIEEINSY